MVPTIAPAAERGGWHILKSFMPFTAAHPAAILPLAARVHARYATSALVIGSMAPDFEYFFRLRPVSSVGHSLLGLFVFCLPAGLVALVGFHAIVKRPAALLLPDCIRSRLTLALTSGCATRHDFWRTPVLVLVGATTHIVWDSFTHARGWAVVRWPALEATAVSFGDANVPVYKLLQHGSTLVGLALLIAAITSWLRHQAVAPVGDGSLSVRIRTVVIASVAATALSTGTLAALDGSPIIGGAGGYSLMTGRFVVGSISGLILALALFGAAVRVARLRLI